MKEPSMVKRAVFDWMDLSTARAGVLVACFDCLGSVHMSTEAVELYTRISSRPEARLELTVRAFLRAASFDRDAALRALEIFETLTALHHKEVVVYAAAHLVGRAFDDPARQEAELRRFAERVGPFEPRTLPTALGIMNIASKLGLHALVDELHAKHIAAGSSRTALGGALLRSLRLRGDLPRCLALYEALCGRADRLPHTVHEQALLACAEARAWTLGAQAAEALRQRSDSSLEASAALLRFTRALLARLKDEPAELPVRSSSKGSQIGNLRAQALATQRRVLRRVLDDSPILLPSTLRPFLLDFADMGLVMDLIAYLRKHEASFRQREDFSLPAFLAEAVRVWKDNGRWRECVMLAEVLRCSPNLVKPEDAVPLLACTASMLAARDDKARLVALFGGHCALLRREALAFLTACDAAVQPMVLDVLKAQGLGGDITLNV